MQKIRQLARMAPDDKGIFAIRRDFSGGVNTRQHPSKLKDTQVRSLDNWDISTPGQMTKRLGLTLSGGEIGDNTILALHRYARQGYADAFICYEDVNVREWSGTGDWSAALDDSGVPDFSASTDIGIVNIKKSGVTPDDVFIVQNGVDNAHEFHKDTSNVWTITDLGSTAGTGSDSPPNSTVMAWYGNRLWVLKNDLLYFSAAYSSAYSTAFDTVTDIFRIPVGQERGIVPTRDAGMIIMGREAIWALAPSATPEATDKPEPIITNRGVVSKKGWVNAGDDIYFFSQDGFRALRRTVQDKLQTGSDYPESYLLKSEFDDINWSYIDKLSMEYYDNRIFISVPTSATTYDTWVYFLPTRSFMVIKDWKPRCWGKFLVSNQERLYLGEDGDGNVYQALSGYTDNATAITATFESKEEDFGQPLIYKSGGEIEIETLAAGGETSISVYVALDGESYQSVGAISLASEDAPTLPVDLPFTLSDSFMIRGKFHLESLGRFRTMQVKLVNSDSNTADITVYGYSIVTFAEEYENE